MAAPYQMYLDYPELQLIKQTEAWQNGRHFADSIFS